VPGTHFWVTDDYQIVENQDAPAEARTFDDKHPELAPARKENTEVLLARAWRGTRGTTYTLPHLWVVKSEIWRQCDG